MSINMKPWYFEGMGFVDNVEVKASGRLMKLTVRNVQGEYENIAVVDVWDRGDLLEDLQTDGAVVEIEGTFRSSFYTSNYDQTERLSQDKRVNRVVRVLLPEQTEAKAGKAKAKTA